MMTIDADNKSLTMEPEARKLRVDMNAQFVTVNQAISDSRSQTKVNNDAINQNEEDIKELRNDLLVRASGGSPNTVGNPALLDRFPLRPADVLKMLEQSAEQKAQGQAYAGRYALTPQRFDVDGNGILKPAPYGLPPTDGMSTCDINNQNVPIITDSCGQYYDAATGIHYRWDQYNPNSNNWVGQHWFLPGPGLSVSLDGLKWVLIRLILPVNGSPFKTAFWVDREGKLGLGNNTLFVSDTSSMYCLPNLTSADGTNLGGSPGPYQDHRLYWDAVVFNGFCVLTLNSGNNYVIVRSGANIHNVSDAFNFTSADDPIIGQIGRVECPSWVRMSDQVTGMPVRQILTIAGQGHVGAGTPGGYYNSNMNTVAMGAGDYTTTKLTLSSKLRWVEWGFWAYAHLIVDPLQQDGTGGTPTYCDHAIMNVGSYCWPVINNNIRQPAWGFSGGQWIPAEVRLINGTPMLQPNSTFDAAMTGKAFTGVAPAQGAGANNTGWTLGITERRDVWRAQMDINQWGFPVGTTIRFHFGSQYLDYVFGKGFIDFFPNHCGNTVSQPNNGTNDNTARNMPLTRDFVTNQNNTLVWEYDNGRIRLYNTNTGEIMSEIVYPNGLQLSTIEVIGNDLFIGGFALTVKLDGGLNY